MAQYLSSPILTAPAAASGAACHSNGSYAYGSWVDVLNPVPDDAVLIGICTMFRLANGAARFGNVQIGVDETVIAEIPYLQAGVANHAQSTPWVFAEPIDAIPAGSAVQARVSANFSTTSFSSDPLLSILYALKPISGNLRTTTIAPDGYPQNAAPVEMTTTAVAWTNSDWVEVIASATTALRLDGYVCSGPGHAEIDIGVGTAGNEAVIQTYSHVGIYTAAAWGVQPTPLPLSGAIPAGSRVAARYRTDDTSVSVARLYLLCSEEY